MSEICPACCSGDAVVHVARPRDREYFVAHEAGILRCRDCRSLFQSPWPSPEETADFYPPGYQDYSESRVPLLRSLYRLQQRAAAQAFVRRHGARATVLDFGCGPGTMLRLLGELGLSGLAGFDFDDRFADPAQPYRYVCDLDDLGERSFDVVRMSHVIEHLSDLDTTMRRLAELLRPGGRIVGQTPRADHYTAILAKGHWGPLHFPFHTVIFSRRGLAAAAPRWRLSLTAWTPTLMPTGWAMTLENLVKPLLAPGRPGRSMAYAPILAASAPFTLLDRLLGSTAIVDFELRSDG